MAYQGHSSALQYCKKMAIQDGYFCKSCGRLLKKWKKYGHKETHRKRLRQQQDYPADCVHIAQPEKILQGFAIAEQMLLIDLT